MLIPDYRCELRSTSIKEMLWTPWISWTSQFKPPHQRQSVLQVLFALAPQSSSHGKLSALDQIEQPRARAAGAAATTNPGLAEEELNHFIVGFKEPKT